MLNKHTPDICLAFPGGRWTKDMIARCTAASIPVYDFLICNFYDVPGR
jgi:hypothetical protein